MTPNSKRFEIDPLTKTRKSGETYFRREITVAQLMELQSSPDGVIQKRVKVQQEEEPDSLKSEALVFLFRTYSEVDPLLSEEIFVTLTLRIYRIIRQFEKDFLVKEDFDDFTRDVNIAVLERIGRLDTDAYDYAQVSFGQWVLYLATNLISVYERANRVRKYSDSIDTSRDDGGDRVPVINLEDMKLSADMRVLLDEALGLLTGNKRDAWLLKVYYGWKISSKDPGEPTIARHFNVSEKTIRNWIEDVEETLLKWKEGRG